MLIDELRVVGSAQTTTVMAAEAIRISMRLQLGRPAKPRKEGTGQLVYPFSLPFALGLLRYARTPTRVVWDVSRSPARRLEQLYDDIRADVAQDRRPWLRDGDRITIEARRLLDFPAGERQVIGAVKNAIIDGAADRAMQVVLDPEQANVQLVVRQDDAGDIVVARDLGAGSLSQRGWRLAQGEAPLREHLAAVMLMLCRYDPRVDTLVDPMCGAGTIPIEAVQMAQGQGRGGQLGLAGMVPRQELANDPPALFEDSVPLAIGCDVDLQVLRAARDNVRRAGVDDRVVLQRADVADLTPRLVDQIASEANHTIERGLFVVNPPYGERLDPGDLRLLYGILFDSLSQFKGWRAGFLVGSREFEPVFGRARIKQPLANGQIRSYFYLYEF